MKYKQSLRIDGNKVISYTTHVATISGNKLIVHGWWSKTTSKHINHVADVYGLTKMEGDKVEQEEKPNDMLRTVSMVAAMGEVFGNNSEEKNAWKKRFLSMHNGLSFPDDFDSLPEEEKQKRLDGAIHIGLEKR